MPVNKNIEAQLWRGIAAGISLHAALLVWDELPLEEKGKDPALIQQIPKILAKAGYATTKA